MADSPTEASARPSDEPDPERPQYLKTPLQWWHPSPREAALPD